MPFRKVSKGSWVNKDEIGESYLEAFKLLLKYGGKITDDRGRNMIIKWASEYRRIDILQYLIDEGYADQFENKDWEDGIRWIQHARKINDTYKQEMKQFLESQVK